MVKRSEFKFQNPNKDLHKGLLGDERPSLLRAPSQRSTRSKFTVLSFMTSTSKLRPTQTLLNLARNAQAEHLDSETRFSQFKQDLGDKDEIKEMKDSVYYGATLALYIIEVVLALVVADVTTMFDFVAAIAVTFIVFAFPGIFYLVAAHRYASLEQREQ
jgi:hypothetical protein